MLVLIWLAADVLFQTYAKTAALITHVYNKSTCIAFETIKIKNTNCLHNFVLINFVNETGNKHL